MTISAIKQTLESNLAAQKDLLNGVPVNAASIAGFLLDLPDPLAITARNTTFTLQDDGSLRVDIAFAGPWPVAGVALGQIRTPGASLVLREGSGPAAISLELHGTFEVSNLKRAFPVTGRLSDPDAWVIELNIDTGDLPGLNELLALAGPGNLADDLDSMGIRLPSVDMVWFGYNLSTRTMAFAGLHGNMQAGDVGLVATCIFDPNLLIFGGLAEGSQIRLTDILRAAGIDAKSAPDIRITSLQLSAQPASRSYTASAALAGDWSLGKIGKSEVVLKQVSVDFSKQGGYTTVALVASARLLGVDLQVEVLAGEQLEFRAIASNVKLKAIVDELMGDVDFPEEIPNIGFDSLELSMLPASGAFSLQAESTEDWVIPLGVAGIPVQDLKFTVSRVPGAKKGTFITSGSCYGAAQIGTVSSSLAYNFPGDFVFRTNLPEIDLSPVIQDLCGAEAMMGISVPNNVSGITFNNIEVMAAPKRKVFTLSGSSPLGKSELIVTKNQQGKWTFIAAFAPPASWRFSALDGSLQPLDNLRMDNMALVLSSGPDRDAPLTVIQLPADLAIGSGLTFFAALDLSDLGVKDLMQVGVLTVSTNIDRNPANIKLAASMGGSFRISENVAMGDMKFFLKPAPSNFELGISGSVLAKLDASDLVFIGTMAIRPIERSAAFAATMLGFWKEPFGIKGLAVGNLALEVGIGIVPPPAVAAPIVGIAGSIAIGSVNGSAAVKFDTANPGKSMIAASFNRLALKEIVQTFCEPKVYNQIPADIRNTVLAAGLQDVAVYAVPQPTTIGELFYEAGFRFQGKLSIAGFDAQFFFLLSYSEGFAIKANMDPIRLGDAFTLAGSGQYPGPTLDVDLRVGGKPGIVIAGLVKLLGLQAETLVQISDKGFLFFIEGKIFDLFVAGLTASGGNLKTSGDFYIKAEMRNDLIAYLRDKARKGIQDAAASATKDIESAQKDVDKAQREVDKIQTEIDNMRKTVQAERARDAKNVKDAENAVAAAQAKVDGLQRDIDNMRKTIQAERDRDTKRLQDAQKAVSAAQSQVNSLQSEINSTKSRIDQLNADIKAKKKWYDDSPWYKKSYRWAEYSAYAAAKGAEITALYTKIGGLETAKATANVALEAAKQVVRGIEAAAKTFPVDADPRILGLFTAKGTATAALEASKQTLRLLQAAIKTFPVDADPRIVGLFTGKGVATAALQSAKGILEATKAAVGGLASVGDFIVKYGLGGLFDVKEARFEGHLNAVKGGSVSMGLKVTLLNKPKSMAITFNFKDPLASVKGLVDQLVAAIK